jgi:hypothetical protein
VKNQPPVTEIIQKRYSCRTYSQAAISKSQQASLDRFLAENRTGPFGSNLRFRLIAASLEAQSDLKDLGTYGAIKNPAGFIIGAVKDEPNSLEDYGYAMEKNILFAARMNLGTCWLGGTFTKSAFADKMGLQANESMPAVAATGHVGSKKSLLEKTMRWGAGADSRKPRQTLFFDGAFGRPLSSEASGEWNTPLEMVRIGPSASNQQPWRIVKHADNNTFYFYLQRTKRYQTRNRILFGMADLQRVDMGIAMCHFEMTAFDLGLAGQWRFEEPDIGRLPEQTSYVASWEAKTHE